MENGRRPGEKEAQFRAKEEVEPKTEAEAQAEFDEIRAQLGELYKPTYNEAGVRFFGIYIDPE